MSSINTNAAAMAAVRSLSIIARDMATTQSRVESGLRVNKANDDPAVFAIAQRMRADLNGLTAVRDSQAFAKAALTVARDAATKVSDELGRLKQTITQGQQQGLDQGQINAQITKSLENIDAYVSSATFNGVNLLNGVGGSLRVLRDIDGNSTNVPSADIRTTGGGLNLTGLNVNQGAVRLSFDSTLDIDDGMGISVAVGGGRTIVFEFNNNNALDGNPGPNTIIRQVEFTAAQSPLQRLGNLINAMRSEGINAFFDSDGSIVVQGASTVTNGGNGTTAITGATVTQIGGAQGAIARVNSAIDIVGGVLANLGSNLRQVEGLQEFTKQLQDSVKEGLGALVDADLAEESARLTSLQTKQQLAVQSLSIANQQSQALLSLFR
jgi:flagellin